jgi:hypothetical protein
VDLINLGHVIDSKVIDAHAQLLSELDFWSEEVRRRIINMDETHHDLSITGDKSGQELWFTRIQGYRDAIRRL